MKKVGAFLLDAAITWPLAVLWGCFIGFVFLGALCAVGIVLATI